MSEEKDQGLLGYAVNLLSIAECVIGQRRAIEQACGYPEEYGGDEELLRLITRFLARPEVAAIAREEKEKAKRAMLSGGDEGRDESH
ncbi:MAG: hypothetical protein ACYSVY_22060 [Planctomycetota bacterium]|jgi:hypothetical protein